MTSTPNSGESQRYWLISSPRTASTMLIKILNLEKQDVLSAPHGGYFFLPSVMNRYALHQKPADEWTDEESKDLQELKVKCFNNLQDYLEKADAQKKAAFVKEHAMLVNHPLIESEFIHGKPASGDLTPLTPRGSPPGTRSAHNKTVHSDEFLKTWKPTFLIRHPARVFESMFRMSRLAAFERAGGLPNPVEATFTWARSLYNFYEEYYKGDSQWPLVLDADDIMQHPELVAKYAPMAGLDPDRLSFSWGKVPQEELDKMAPRQKGAQSFLYASDKVDLSKVAGNINIDEEAVKWRAEFGEDGGAKLEQLVRDSMADYEFLRSKRLTLD